jgi:hypothetical protein
VFKNGPKKSADFDRFCGVSNYYDRFWEVYSMRSQSSVFSPRSVS